MTNLLDVPSLWPVRIGTSVTNEEVAFIGHASFKTKIVKVSYLNTTYGDGVAPMGSFAPIRKKQTSHAWSTKWRHGISKEAERQIASAESMTVIVLKGEIVVRDFHVVFHMQAENSYEVHIQSDPSCTCPDFQKREQ